jgi:hypothetical protein
VTALTVALAWWAMLGAHPPACLHVQLAELAPRPNTLELGRGEVGGCNVWINRRILPARTRKQALRVCWAVIHEVGHTLGLEHTATGIMTGTYVPGTEPGICWNLKLPVRCIVCRGPDTLNPAET